MSRLEGLLSLACGGTWLARVAQAFLPEHGLGIRLTGCHLAVSDWRDVCNLWLK